MTPSLNVRFVKYIYKYFRLRLVIKKKYLSKSRYHSSFKYFFIALSTDDNLHHREDFQKEKVNLYNLKNRVVIITQNLNAKEL